MMQYVYTNIFYQNHCLTVVPKSQGDIQSILDTYLKNFTSIAVESDKATLQMYQAILWWVYTLKDEKLWINTIL